MTVLSYVDPAQRAVQVAVDAMPGDAADVRSYLPRLAGLLVGGHRAADGSAHRRVSGSPAPWHTPTGNLITDVHAGARYYADALAVPLGHAPWPRGSGEAATVRALSHMSRLARAVNDRLPSAALPVYAAAELGVWARRARALLDELRPGEEPWTRAPGGLRCPNPVNPAAPAEICDRPLWLAPGGVRETSPAVFCLRCRDEGGRLYSWPHAAWVMVVDRQLTTR